MFLLSQLVHFLMDPIHILVLLIAGVAVLEARRQHRRKRSRWLTFCWAASLAWMLNLLVPIAPYYTVMALENRFPKPDEAARPIDHIVVLGGWQGPGDVIRARQEPLYGSAVERLLRGLELRRNHPEAKLYLAGGLKQYPDAPSEGEIARMALKQLGVDAAQIMIEDRSRNTSENAHNIAAMVPPGEHIVLITSAVHMPRAMAVFRAAGVDPLALPTDYITNGGYPRWKALSGSGVFLTRVALREVVGLAAYRLLGRTDKFIPAP